MRCDRSKIKRGHLITSRFWPTFTESPCINKNKYLSLWARNQIIYSHFGIKHETDCAVVISFLCIQGNNSPQPFIIKVMIHPVLMPLCFSSNKFIGPHSSGNSNFNISIYLFIYFLQCCIQIKYSETGKYFEKFPDFLIFCIKFCKLRNMEI